MKPLKPLGKPQNKESQLKMDSYNFESFCEYFGFDEYNLETIDIYKRYQAGEGDERLYGELAEKQRAEAEASFEERRQEAIKYQEWFERGRKK
tara:strand:- start:357 stop:635 length:279 start_codon:yes stop_codon:yes gene_type:complete